MANLELDPLDDTRVHPRDYELAIEIASSAVGGDASAKEVAVENALAQPKEVTALQLNAYATHLDEHQNKPNMLARLIDIQFEFVAPYGELRFRSQQLKVGRRDATPARHKIVGLASRSYVPTRPPPCSRCAARGLVCAVPGGVSHNAQARAQGASSAKLGQGVCVHKHFIGLPLWPSSCRWRRACALWALTMCGASCPTCTRWKL